MRSWFFLAFFASGLAIVTWQLFGEEGSHARLAMLETALAEQNRVNESLRLRNEELAAEVFSLENREEAIEEQARRHLYMIRPNEVLFRYERGPNAKGDLSIVDLYPSPKLESGAKPTFEPKRSDLYRVPERLRAPKARNRRD